MVFKCQEDSFLKSFTTTVVSCEPAKFLYTDKTEKKEINGYEVICEDTILFPEGGGQPADTGYMNDKFVYNVERRGDKAVHYVEEGFEQGTEVKQIVKWERRFDHMQQHSGQHLLSALLENDLNIPTVAWWLGEDVSYVELDVPTFSPTQIKEVEDKLNLLIREARKVTVKVLNNKDEMDEAHTRGLPADHVGAIRVIVIDGIDNNMCCGTHVSNLSQLQVIKLLTVEKSKRKNKCLLNFLVGNRVLRKFYDMFKREMELTKTLNNGPLEHVNLVKKQIGNLKSINKTLQSMLKETAVKEAKKLKALDTKPPYFILHKKEADSDFMSIFIRELDDYEILLFLSVGDENGPGNFIITGPEDHVVALSDNICTVLNGKGSRKGNKFQGKVSRMTSRIKADDIIIKYFEK